MSMYSIIALKREFFKSWNYFVSLTAIDGESFKEWYAIQLPNLMLRKPEVVLVGQ
jgi:hypothetical protein